MIHWKMQRICIFANFTSLKSRIALPIKRKIALCDSTKFTCINDLVNLKTLP